MEVETLPNSLSKEFIQKIQKLGIRNLNPPQMEAINNGLLENKNLLISSPTASGKTLIASMAVERKIQESKKSLYVVPLRSLGMEKYRQFSELFGKDNVGISTGDFDSSGGLQNRKIIILTVEKLDSLLRHGIPWINQIGLVVFDEIHLLNDPERGPTLEMTITKLINSLDFQVLALSATVQNSKEVAEWLNCKLIESDYRPVNLKEGVLFNNNIEFSSEDILNEFNRATKMKNYKPFQKKFDDELLNFLHDLKNESKQAIIFVNSRKSAEAFARKLSEIFPISPNSKLPEKCYKALSSPTRQCEALRNCLKRRVAFHHAGLVHKQKSLIEESFLDGNLDFIIATPTLAMGVSLPSYAVLIRDLKRFGNYGMDFIPVMEYKQMAGRAGRPEHHSEGIAVSYVTNEEMKKEVQRRYIYGKVENIYSKLAVEPILRFHLLGLIASSFGMTKEDIFSFFSKTFYFYQYRDSEEINRMISSILDRLEDYGFVNNKEDMYEATLLGKRTAELYLDPETALKFINILSMPFQTEFLYLYTICDAIESKPLFSARKKDFEYLETHINELEKFLEIPEEWDYYYDEFLKKVKTSVVFQEWIEEKNDNYLLETYGITPGILRGKTEIANWLLYSMRELARVKKLREKYSEVEKLRRRIRYGVKEELLPLVKLRGIGRARARKLHQNNIRNIGDLKNSDLIKLSGIIGSNTASKLLEQVK